MKVYVVIGDPYHPSIISMHKCKEKAQKIADNLMKKKEEYDESDSPYETMTIEEIDEVLTIPSELWVEEHEVIEWMHQCLELDI